MKPEIEKSQRHRKRFPSGKEQLEYRVMATIRHFSRDDVSNQLPCLLSSSISQEQAANAVLVSWAGLACETNSGYLYSFSRSYDCNSKYVGTISHFLNTLSFYHGQPARHTIATHVSTLKQKLILCSRGCLDCNEHMRE